MLLIVDLILESSPNLRQTELPSQLKHDEECEQPKSKQDDSPPRKLVYAPQRRAPKKLKTALRFYQLKMRPQFKEEDPTRKAEDCNRLASKAREKLGSDQRKPYASLAEEDKKRYEQEIKEYVPSKEVLETPQLNLS